MQKVTIEAQVQPCFVATSQKRLAENLGWKTTVEPAHSVGKRE